ncbi:MAG: nitroreductase family protein [Planctomycetota bacterium]
MPGMTDLSHLPNPLSHRKADHDVLPIFVERWSPRAMSGEALSDGDIHRIFEAGRWAPSTYNEQEWRFLLAKRDTAHFDVFMSCLVEANQAWCKHAGLLVVVTSHTTFSQNGKANPVHTFDAGLATQNMLLQAASMGLVGHAMAGYDGAAVREKLEVPTDVSIDVMIAFGKPGDPDAQLPEAYAKMDKTPSGRRPISDSIREGGWSF